MQFKNMISRLGLYELLIVTAKCSERTMMHFPLLVFVGGGASVFYERLRPGAASKLLGFSIFLL